MRAIRRRAADVEFVGYGGPQMAEAGCRLFCDLTSLAVMWLLRVLLNLHRFARLISEADRYFRHYRPDAVVLIDYPGFNWWVARRAKAHGIRVFYYTPPQIWAWASWRVKKMRKFVDHVLCALEFETDWFRNNGCRATFVGHPFFDEVRRHRLDERLIERLSARPGPLVAILPGSRTQEVEHNLPAMLEAARMIRSEVPAARFAVAAFRPHQAQMAQRMIRRANVEADVFLKKTPELIHLADACMSVSGSVSLELLAQARPTVIVYRISRLAWFVQRFFRRVKYITLVNLLVAREVFPKDVTPYDPDGPDAKEAIFPEYLTCENPARSLARHVVRWLTDRPEREAVIRRLERLRQRVGQPGSTERAAAFIVDLLDEKPKREPRTHYTGAVPKSTQPRPSPSRGRAA